MEIELEMIEIVNAVSVINKIMTVEMDAVLGLKIAILAKKLEIEAKSLDEKRNALVKKYANESEPNKVADENNDKFIEDYNKLLRTTVNVSVSKLKKEDFVGFKTQAGDMYILEKFIE